MKPASVSNPNFFVGFPGRLYTAFNQELTPAAWCVLSLIYFQADFETGFWKGSADKIVAGWSGKLGGRRTVQRVLNLLRKSGYIKSFHAAGHRGNYLVAIEGYVVRFGPRKWQVLDAAQTTSPDHPVYTESKGQDGQNVTLINQKTCRRETDRNPKQDAGLVGRDEKRDADKEGGGGHNVSHIPEVPEQHQHHGGGDDGQFLTEVYGVLDSHGASSTANLNPQKQALALAAKFGQQTFLRALSLWLTEEGSHWQKKDRRHGLAHFVSPGKCDHYVGRLNGHAATAVDGQRKQQEADATRKRQAVKDELIREEDIAGREFAAWETRQGTADGFVPTDPDAFERYAARQRVKDWTQDSGESWGDLDTQRQAGLAAAIDARMAEVSA